MPRTEDHDEQARKVAELLKGSRIAMLTTLASDGSAVSRPMALQEVDFDGDVWFFVARDAHAVTQAAADPRVNVTTGSGGSWVSLNGSATVVDDAAKKHQLWDATVQAWFPEGPDSPDIVLLHVEAESAEYWDTPGGRIATILSFAKATITGRPASGGENERVDLSHS